MDNISDHKIALLKKQSKAVISWPQWWS